MNDSDDMSIKQLIQNMVGGEVQLIRGEVKSVSPLRIVTDDEKLTLNGNITIVPKRITLNVGDEVHILSLSHGKEYYILDRA